MIDTQIESTPTFPFLSAFFALAGVGLMLISVPTEEPGCLIASIPCWTVAFSLFVARQRSFSATLTPDGLDMRETGQMISYESIDSVQFAGKTNSTGGYVSQQAPISISYDGGALTIPARVSVPSNELFEFLLSRFEPRTTFALNPLLDDFANEQADTFGDDKVFRFTARHTINAVPLGGTTSKAIGIGMLLGAAGWVVAAVAYDPAWVGGAIAMAVVGVLVLLIGFAKSRSPTAGIKDWQNSGLVISPVGLAMVQGPLKGRLRWDELRNVTLNEGRKSFRVSSGPMLTGIMLQVEGSALVIADLYNQPLASVHSTIMQYWRGDGMA